MCRMNRDNTTSKENKKKQLLVGAAVSTFGSERKRLDALAKYALEYWINIISSGTVLLCLVDGATEKWTRWLSSNVEEAASGLLNLESTWSSHAWQDGCNIKWDNV